MAKRERLWEPNPHRAVDYDPAAIQKVIDKVGYILVSPKVDGMRAIVRVHHDGAVDVVSREGIEILSLQDRVQAFQALPEGTYDCEVLIRGVPFETSTGILRRYEVVPDELFVEFHVFDLWIPVAALERQHRLQALRGTHPTPNHTGIFLVPVSSAYTLQDCDTFYKWAREAEWEGVVYKHPLLPPRNGKVSGWWKRKPDITVDGKVVDVVWGDPGKANAGLIVGYVVELEDGARCNATGLSQEHMQWATGAWEGAQETFGAHPIIGRYVEVTAMERTSKGNLRHPHWSRWRDLEGSEGVKA